MVNQARVSSNCLLAGQHFPQVSMQVWRRAVPFSRLETEPETWACVLTATLMIPKCDLHIDATQHQLLVSVFTKGAKSDLPWDWVIVGVMEEWALPHTMGRLACKIRST